MNGSVLLDTTILVEHFRRGSHTRRLLQYGSLYITPITVGELYYGAYRSAHFAKKEAEINDFLRIVSVLALTPQTCRHYGEAKAVLAGQGQMIPENDLWIAAFALEHQLPVATKDDHFGRVAGLAIEKWEAA